MGRPKSVEQPNPVSSAQNSPLGWTPTGKLTMLSAEGDMNEQATEEEDSCPIDLSGNQAVIGEYWRWCPRCSAELINRKCKLLCPRCHYFMSCSDFD